MTKRSRRAAASAPERARPTRGQNGAIDIAVRSTVRMEWVDPEALRAASLRAAQAEGFRSGMLSIAIVGRAAMSRLHETHSGDPTPTDVLTFDLGTDRRRGRIDGEIIVCASVALAASRQHSTGGGRDADGARFGMRHPALAELVLYVVHGVLHLAGHDDHAEAAFRRMHSREDEILSALGWGPVFARPAASAGPIRIRR